MGNLLRASVAGAKRSVRAHNHHHQASEAFEWTRGLTSRKQEEGCERRLCRVVRNWAWRGRRRGLAAAQELAESLVVSPGSREHELFSVARRRSKSRLWRRS